MYMNGNINGKSINVKISNLLSIKNVKHYIIYDIKNVKFAKYIDYYAKM